MTTNDSHILRDERRHNDSEASRKWARRHTEPWSKDEDEFIVVEWIKVDPNERDEVTVSQCLERTIIACRRRAQELRALMGMSAPGFKKKVETAYVGSMDDPEDRWWSADYYTDGGSHA